MTTIQIRAKARRLKQRNDLKLIETTGQGTRSPRDRDLSQLNRGPEQRTDKRPMLSDLRGPGPLEQDADMMILVHRPDAWEADDPRAGEADLIIAKPRNGPTTTVAVAHPPHVLEVCRPRRIRPGRGTRRPRRPPPDWRREPARSVPSRVAVSCLVMPGLHRRFDDHAPAPDFHRPRSAGTGRRAPGHPR